MERVTLADVAKYARVSPSTVSHVINNTRFVTEETRQQVLQAISALNYYPNQVARSLIVKRTYTAGLLITDVGNPFYHRIILGVENVALANGYSVFLFNASYDQARSIKYIRSMIERRADGILLMSSRMSEDILDEATRHNIPTVVLDWNEFEVQKAGAVSFDFDNGIRQAITHLIELGHRRFAHVSGDLELWTARIRRDLFLSILAEHGVDPASVPVIEGNFQIDGGRRALHQLMDAAERPTAIFTINDLTAIGLMIEAKHLGLSVPEDFSVVGVDDIALAAEMTPALTTIAIPGYQVGEQCMTMLLDMLNRAEDDSLEHTDYRRVVKTELIVRESTAVPPNDAR